VTKNTPVYHKDCGGLVAHYEGELETGTIVLAEKFRLTDGTYPAPHDVIRVLCPRCGAVITNFSRMRRDK